MRREEVAGQRTSKRTHGGGLLASSVRRALLILLAITGWSLGGTDPILFAREERGPDSSVAIPLILSAPEAYEGKTVIIRGTVEAVKRAKFPNGRSYHTLVVQSGDTTLAAFSWEHPGVRPGDSVQVEGVFHTSRYNIHHIVETRRVSFIRMTSGLEQERNHAP